jgi:hypothetical protein
MDAVERSTIDALRQRLAEVERERDALLSARAQAEQRASRLAERYAVLDARWRRSSVGGVVLFRTAHQIWTHFARWQEALARHRPDREVVAAWSQFDRTMAGLPAALADAAAGPDAEPVAAIEHLVSAMRALLASARQCDLSSSDDGPGEMMRVDGSSLDVARRAIERYEKLPMLDSVKAAG